ncbi:MAG TPA: phytoene desaturase [Longimicrobium sp.]|jgi:phytoene desaturase|uniref:phytoene desaturase n=1 Tax=Longimicrobium sp. TaxID=2029185 RepID=UPI002ED7FA8A
MSGSRAVVIGSGFGGLAAAVRLRARGYGVTLLEALDQPGGRARVFRQDGFTWDAGPTVITAPYLLEELFALAGRDMADYVKLVPVDPFYRILYPDGSTFDYVGDEERLIAQIRAMSPRDVDGYRKLAAHAERIFDVGYTQLADQPFDRVSDMARVIPQMIRLGSHRSVYGMVSRYIHDERLRQALTFEPLLVGGNPFSTTSIYLLIHWLERKWGVHFAMGGTTSIVAGLVKLLGEMDVDVRMSSPVEEIEVSGGRAVAVRTADGERFAADVVVANADPSRVYGQMIGKAHRRRHTDRSLRRRRQSMSLFVAYFGSRKQFPELAHHTIVLGDRYKPLLDDIFTRRVLADDFSLYLHAPTRTDPSLAPEGKEGFYVLSPVPNTRAGIDWSREAQPYWERIRASLEKRLLPGLGESPVKPFFLTPHDFEHTLRSEDGAAFGLEPILTQSAYFRYHNRSEDVGGLYFVGAGTHPGGGVPGVLCSARVLDRVVPAPRRAA